VASLESQQIFKVEKQRSKARAEQSRKVKALKALRRRTQRTSRFLGQLCSKID